MNSQITNLKKDTAEAVHGATEAAKDAARTAAEKVKAHGKQSLHTASDIMADGKRQASDFAQNAREMADDLANKAEDIADDMADKADDMADAAASRVSAVVSKVKSTAQAARDSVMDTAGPALAGLRDAALEKADVARESLSDVGNRLADTLSRAAEGPQADALKSRAFSSMATGVASASQMLRERSVADLSADVRAMARRHPGAFIAGAAVMGFAVARFMRASGARKAQTPAQTYADAFYGEKDLRS